MDELLLIAVVISIVLNILLFFFLYNKKRDSDEHEGFEESEILEKVLEAEIHKVERYDEYSFSLARLTLSRCPDTLLAELHSFVRKSDSVYALNGTIYLIFPFLRLQSVFIQKMNKDLLDFIRSNHSDIEVIEIQVQECNIHEMLQLDDVLKKENL